MQNALVKAEHSKRANSSLKRSRYFLLWILGKSGRHTLDSGKLLAHHLVHSRHLKSGTYYYGEATLPVVRAQVLESDLGINCPF